MNNFKERIVVFDLEATCDKAEFFDNEIIEIGAVDNFGNEFSHFIKPIVNPLLTDFCKELTTIKQTDVDSAHEFPHVYTEFNDFITGDKYGGEATIFSWGFYDKNQLLKDCQRHGINGDNEYFAHNHVNLKTVYKEIMGTKARGMAHALRKFNIELEGTHHRGIDDARNIFKIYQKLMDCAEEKENA